MSVHAGGRGMGHVSRLVRLGPVASLRLNLLSGTWLDPRITFSRGSQAMVTDATGKLTYAPNNLLTNSESFEAASWSKNNVTVTSNSTAAPDGTLTADTLDEGSATANHAMFSGASPLVAGLNYVASIYLKAGTARWIQMPLLSATFGSNAWANFDLVGGVVGNVGSAVVSTAITSVGDGWYRCTIVAPCTVAGSGGSLQVGFTDNTNSATRLPSYAGSNKTVFAWGAQLEQVTYQTTPGTYNSTSPKNLLGYTQEFDNAAWAKQAITVAANSTTAPDGTATADTLVESTANLGHVASSAVTAITAPYVFSVYLKKGSGSTAPNWLQLYTGGVSAQYANFNLGAGAVGSVAAGSTATITSVGNGWYRCTLSFTPSSGGSASVAIAFTNNTDTTTRGPSYAGATTSDVFIWGAQLSNSASVDPYVYNPVAAPSSTAYYGPRFDYDPVTLAPKGLLIEEQRTNLATYSEQFDNAAWTKSNATVTADATTSPDGTADADKIVATAVSGTHFASRSNVVNSGSITISVYAKASGYNWLFLGDGVTTANGANFNLSNGTVGGVGGNASASIVNVGNGWYRCVVVTTATTGSGLTAFVLNAENGFSYTGDGTSGIFIYGAQLEAGAFATSYIPTGASQVTRTADVATITGANFSQWYNQSEGTFVVGADVAAVNFTTQQNLLSLHTSGTNLMRFWLWEGSPTNARWTVTNSTTQADLASGTLTANTPFKAAAVYSLNDFAASYNGAPALTDTSGTVPVGFTQLNIGSQTGLFGFMNGHIRSISYYNTRLPNLQFQALTS